MAILPINVYGDKILRKKTELVKQVDDDLIVEIQDMLTTMRNANGVGLAANQVNIDKSIFVIDLSPNLIHDKQKWPIYWLFQPKIYTGSRRTVR